MRNNWKIITFVWSGTLRLNSVDGDAEMLLNVIEQVCSLRVPGNTAAALTTCPSCLHYYSTHLSDACFIHVVRHCPFPCWQASATASHALPSTPSRLQLSLTKANTVAEAASFPVPTVPHASKFQCLLRLPGNGIWMVKNAQQRWSADAQTLCGEPQNCPSRAFCLLTARRALDCYRTCSQPTVPTVESPCRQSAAIDWCGVLCC